MANDWRVLVIKLADRLHNMRTIVGHARVEAAPHAQETLDIYAPLAHRLGIQELKWQLEDLSFATLHPKRYAEIEQMVATRAPERDDYLARGPGGRPSAGWRRSGIEADVTGRPKHLWSIYEKMVVRGKEFDEIHDLVGIRVIVDSEKDCWAALGIDPRHLDARCRAASRTTSTAPKFNLYQSLHTTVIGPAGQAHRGPDPHPGDAPAGRVRHRRPLGLQGAGRARRGGHRGRDGLAAADRRLAAGDHRPDRVPRDPEARPRPGRGLRLHARRARSSPCRRAPRRSTSPTPSTPRSATAASGAKVNGRLVPLDTELQSADTVEIFTSKIAVGRARRATGCRSSPRRGRATRSASGSSRERREDAIDSGREELDQGAAPRGTAGADSSLASSALERLRPALELRRPRRAATRRSASGHVSAPVGRPAPARASCAARARGAAADDGRAAAAGRAHAAALAGRATSRASTT